jgi:hypothetical protein
MARERHPVPAGGPPARRSGVPWGWVAVGAVAALAVVTVVQVVLAFLFGLVRLAIVVVAIAVIGWLVVVGPPDRKRR